MIKYEHKSGWITLYNNKGHMMVKKRYATIWQRKKTIERWENFYLDRFNNFYYHISPDLVMVREKELA
jgi:hypothetical protein